MKLRLLLSFLRRRLWLIALAALVGGSLGYVYARSQPVQYQASSTMQFSSDCSLVNPALPWEGSKEELVKNYVALSKTRLVLDAVIKNSALPINADTLAGLFRVEQIKNTSFLTITATYTNPKLTADIANTVASELIDEGPPNCNRVKQGQLDQVGKEFLETDTQLKAEGEELKT